MEELIKFIEANDISGVRAVLQNEILWNTSSKEDVNNMIELCDKNEVFDEHDGKMLSYNIAEYDDEQLLNLKSDLTFNFSKERYILAYKVSRVLNEKNKSEESNNELPRVNTSYKEKEENSDKIWKNLLKAGSLIGITVLSVLLIKRKKKIKCCYYKS